jgi:hypothetical protein
MSCSWSCSCGRQSVDQYVWVSGFHLGPLTRFYVALLLSFDNYVVLLSMRPLWRENGSVIYLYNCFWTLPEQSHLSRSPTELTAIFYCLIWDSPNLEGQVPVFISPRNRVAQIYPRALCSLSVASYDSRGLRWRYSNPPPHGVCVLGAGTVALPYGDVAFRSPTSSKATVFILGYGGTRKHLTGYVKFKTNISW